MPTLHTMKHATKRNNLYLRVAMGHFATSNCHTNYYVDVVSQKARLSEASAVAEELCSYYYTDTVVDTILCLDGTEVINGGQLLFRDNIVPMINGKNVMILAVSVSSGKTVEAAVQAVNYYGGKAAGISAIFSTAKECAGLPVRSVFDPNDLPDYKCYPAHECPLCKAGVKLDALINSHGFSKL